MRDVIHQLIKAIDEKQPLVYCRLVETRGSTPQKAGAMMVVFPDGSQAGTLGGGCVEAEVKRRALLVLDNQPPEIATFQLDSDYGWDDGLICGGSNENSHPTATQWSGRGLFPIAGKRDRTWRGCTGSGCLDDVEQGVPSTAMYLLNAGGEILAVQRAEPSIGLPANAKDGLRPLEAQPHAYAAQGIAFLPILPRCRLLIVGGGHVGKAVAQLASDLNFDIWVVDDREEFVHPDRFPQAQRRVYGPIDQVLPSLDITPDTYCLIVTRGHNHDERALYYLVDRGARYVGLIGSRRKIKMIYEDLLAEGISPEALSRVHAPVGLDIGSQTVPEIAISICAELISHRNRQGIVPGRPDSVPVPK